MWKKLSSRIEEFERSRNPLSQFLEIIPQYAATLVAVVLFSIGVFVGIFLGSFPNSQSPSDSTSNSILSAGEQFVESLYLDSFHDLPPESLGGIYVTLTSEKK